MRLVFLLFTPIHAFFGPSFRHSHTFLRYNDNPRDKENLRKIDDQINRYKKILKELLDQKSNTIENLTGLRLITDPGLFFNTLNDEDDEDNV